MPEWYWDSLENYWCLHYVRSTRTCFVVLECLDCGKDINYRHRNSIRCEACQEKIDKSRARIRRQANRPIRYCLRCGIIISHMSSGALRCEYCSKIHLREFHRNYTANYRADPKHWEHVLQHQRDYRAKKNKPKPICQRCGCVITDKKPPAQYCGKCYIQHRAEYKQQYAREHKLALFESRSQWRKDNADHLNGLKRDWYRKNRRQYGDYRLNVKYPVNMDGFIMYVYPNKMYGDTLGIDLIRR